MPVTPTYPGVYIEEIPSGVRTIMGVATSITALIGRAVKGETNEPKSVMNYGEFTRLFGGLHVDFPMSYAVKDFFLNGGGQAVIVRLFKKGAKLAKATLTKGTLKFEAASEGGWANTLRIRVDSQVSQDVADTYGLAKTDLFNLTVYDTKTGESEVFLNLSVKESPARADRVLKARSSLLRVSTALGLNTSPTAVPAAHTKDAAAGKTIWTDPQCSTGVAPGDVADNGVALDKATYEGDKILKTGLYALDKVDIFNLLCIPADTRGGDTQKEVYQTALKYCVDKRAMLIVDPPAAWTKPDDITKTNFQALTDLGLSGTAARNAAIFFPRIVQADPLRKDQLDVFVPSGAIAGIFSRTDAARGVWKAGAGVDAAVSGIQSLAVSLTDEENGTLNPIAVNCLRTFPLVGSVVWGGRTMRGADVQADEYKYCCVRRLALYLEESVLRASKWIIFEPNDEPLWAQIRLNVGVFMHDLFRQGAFQGTNPRDAYFVKCDKETNPQSEIDKGIVNIVIGFAPLKPAEFVIIKIQQLAGQLKA